MALVFILSALLLFSIKKEGWNPPCYYLDLDLDLHLENVNLPQIQPSGIG